MTLNKTDGTLMLNLRDTTPDGKSVEVDLHRRAALHLAEAYIDWSGRFATLSNPKDAADFKTKGRAILKHVEYEMDYDEQRTPNSGRVVVVSLMDLLFGDLLQCTGVTYTIFDEEGNKTEYDMTYGGKHKPEVGKYLDFRKHESVPEHLRKLYRVGDNNALHTMSADDTKTYDDIMAEGPLEDANNETATDESTVVEQGQG